jgi:hypothetical protein
MKVNHELIDSLVNKFKPPAVESVKLRGDLCISQDKDSFLCGLCKDIIN